MENHQNLAPVTYPLQSVVAREGQYDHPARKYLHTSLNLFPESDHQQVGVAESQLRLRKLHSVQVYQAIIG
jgi:hypothetical protein